MSQLSGFYIMTHLTLSKLIKFQNDHIFQHNGFINVDKRYLDTFLIKKNEATKRYFGDDFLKLPCCLKEVP